MPPHATHVEGPSGSARRITSPDRCCVPRIVRQGAALRLGHSALRLCVNTHGSRWMQGSEGCELVHAVSESRVLPPLPPHRGVQGPRLGRERAAMGCQSRRGSVLPVKDLRCARCSDLGQHGAKRVDRWRVSLRSGSAQSHKRPSHPCTCPRRSTCRCERVRVLAWSGPDRFGLGVCSTGRVRLSELCLGWASRAPPREERTGEELRVSGRQSAVPRTLPIPLPVIYR